MPALAQPTGSEIMNTLVPSGDGGALGSWTEQTIDDYVASALVNVVTAEFDYASELLTDAGFTPASLSTADWNKATAAMLYGIGYQLTGFDFAANTPISGENGGVRVDAYMKADSRYYNAAGRAWASLGITTSKYARNYVISAVGSVERNGLSPTSIYPQET